MRKTIYHYTTLEGFLGIIENNCLWLSNPNYLNDESEIKYAEEIFKEKEFKERIKYYLNNGKDEKFLTGNFTVNEVFMSPDRIYKPKDIKEKFDYNLELFTASFCEEGDLLSQWKGYSKKNGGVSIGFDYNKLKKLECNLINVKYNKNDIYKILADEYIEYLNFKKKNKLYNLINLKKAFVQCKDISFIEEKEVRIIKIMDKSNNEIKYRLSEGLIIPYYKLDLGDLSLMINSIIIDPRYKYNMRIKESIINFLENKGINITKVKYSEIPFV